MKERFRVTGMTCSACSSHVEKAVCKLEGIDKVSVNLLTGTMDVEYEEGKQASESIITAVVQAGYGAEAMSDKPKSVSDRGGLQKKAAEEEKGMRMRLGVSMIFLVLLMAVSMYHMYYEVLKLPALEAADGMTYALTQFLLLLPILYMNRKFFAVGFKALWNRSPNMDSLVALGASAAVGYGVFAMYRISYGLGHGDMALAGHYTHDLYFESAGMILSLITIGKYLEGRSKGKTSEAISKLLDLSPKTAVVLRENGTEEEIPTEALRQGDVFLLKPGSMVPVDGIVLEGTSSVDESAITGESMPVEKQSGDKVVSATMNRAGFLKCCAERVGEDTTLAQIIRLVEEASAGKAPIARLADKVAGVFVPVVIGIALVTLVIWLCAGADVEFALSCAIAVLVISCPCALGLATPVAIMVGTGVGAKQGILIKSGEALQKAKEIDTVVLDKTGTITSGRLKVMGVGVYVPEMTTEELMAIAAALEKKSEHPLAEAVVEFASREKITVPDAAEFQAVFGRGVEGVVAGSRYYVGNRAYLEEQNIVPEPMQLQGMEDWADEGMTPLLVANESRLIGIIGVADELKASSVKAIREWHKMGIRVMMLTGDNRRTAEAVRNRLDLEEVIAEVLPQEKEKIISKLQAKGHRVAMIGDGINDAPALAAADVGMAIGAGTDVAMESADIVLMKSDLRDAVTAMKLSRAVIRNIKENLFWAFFYNSIGIPLAAGLWYPLFEVRLSPMFGAAAMSLSSIFVVCNALRLRNFKSGFSQMQEKQPEGIKTEEINEEEREQTMTKVITIEGMMCAHCTGRVQKVLEAVEGVGEVTMSLENKTAAVKLVAEVADDTLVAVITEAGYEVISIS